MSMLYLIENLDAATKTREDIYAATENLARNYAMSGAMEQVLDALAEDVSAADLNAAAAGTFERIFTCSLETPLTAILHAWCFLLPVLTPGEACADPDIGPPVVVGTPNYNAGVATVRLTFDTDAGATKTYAPGDSVSCSVQVSAANMLLGWPVAMVTKTYNVIA